MESLQRALRKEELVSTGFKAALALEEEKKKEDKIKIVELEVRMSKSILEMATRVVEEFKASFEMKDLNIIFGQNVFIKDFKLYKGRVARRFSKLDLRFLKEEPDEEAGPFGAASDPSPTKVVFEPFEPTVKVPETM
ncbi:hypothetical protein COCNU_09G008040 [Cocos nucifera]|uniref:Uncharacterized protein n=1 Tax=Cocos nucifera TaxID=13894 RepID=A0A8K0IKW3_COCNU|nr:hypothetical protein COCNU_09G008040 [Cocos nucifera]